MATSGSIRKAAIGGINYNVAADANVSKTPTQSKEGIRHSGGNMMKVTKLHGSVEGLTLICTPAEFQSLETLAENDGGITLSYTLADGSAWTCTGEISLDNYESEENRVDVTMIPELGIWDLFAK